MPKLWMFEQLIWIQFQWSVCLVCFWFSVYSSVKSVKSPSHICFNISSWTVNFCISSPQLRIWSAEKFIQTWPLHASLIYFLDMDPNPPPTPSKLWRIILESSGVCLATEMLYRILVWVCSKYAIDKFWQTIWSKHTVGLLAVSQANSLRKQTTGKIPSNFGTHGRSSRILLQVPLVHNHGPSLWAAREDGRKNQNSTANAWYKYLLAAEVTMVLR